MPSARSIAFTAGTAWHRTAGRPLHDATGLLAVLVTRSGFTVPDRWLR